MTLHAVTDEQYLHWYCKGGREFEDDPPCDFYYVNHLEEAEYLLPPDTDTARGAVIGLPWCPECGSRTFLKADYNINELAHCVQTVVNDAGIPWAHVLPYRHIHSLHAHALLYERGLAKYPPIVDMPPLAALNHPEARKIGDPDLVRSLWIARSVVALHSEQRTLARVPRPLRLGAPAKE